MSQEAEHTHIPDECYQQRIQELAEMCDHEFYTSALPSVTNKERAIRGKNRIVKAIEEFIQIQQNAKCAGCLEEINKQIRLQEEGLKGIEQEWNL